MGQKNETALTIIRKERPALDFTDDQRAMIRNSYASGANEEEFAVLIEIAKAKRLNPLLGQIHFVKRWTRDRGDVWATQTGIDGFRAIAEDTGLYNGQDEPEFTYDDNGRLQMARVKVYRKDIDRPFVGLAHYAEYVQKTRDGGPNTMWATKPHIMLAKCAEALALRKAFPSDLGDIYTADELPKEDGPPLQTVGALPKPAAATDTLAETLQQIQEAADLKALDRIATRLANMALTAQQRKKASAAFVARRDALGKADAPKGAAEAPQGDAVKPCEECGGNPGQHHPDCPIGEAERRAAAEAQQAGGVA